MNAHTVFAVIFALLDLACIIAVIFFERKNPASTIAWVLVLIFLPLVGFLAYAMFGSGFHVNKRKRYAIKQLSDSLNKRTMGKYLENQDECAQCDESGLARMISYLNSEGGHRFTLDNEAEIFTSGGECFDRMLADMRAAKSSIHLLYYIFRDDSLGREVAATLARKAGEGVAVRVIYDSLGSMLGKERVFKALKKAGGQVAAFSPLFSHISSHLRLNYRNHRKITVIDGLAGYVGGMNVGVEYLGRHKRLRPWRDTSLRITGDAVGFLQERFLLDWASVSEDDMAKTDMHALFPPPPRSGRRLGMQIVSSGPDSSTGAIKNGLLEMLYSARKYLYIQTPYFTPDDSFIDALRIAAASGVDVRLMIPGLKENPLVSAATYSYAQQLLQAGVRVFRYRGFLHAKTMVSDGIAATVGTANIGTRSFALNFEINAFIYGRDFAARCEKVFLYDQTQCEELSEEWFKALRPAVRIAFGISRLFAPLI
ncbi:cardiolipin synthase [Desulfovibrio sp. OttesenSCG-928-A18]|nr:cardiolipin synthase [Desulfovibrio sp. OttesenSCG-928-A18]